MQQRSTFLVRSCTAAVVKGHRLVVFAEVVATAAVLVEDIAA